MRAAGTGLGHLIQLQAADGHTLDAYRADPPERPKGGLVVVQGSFGVNEHIRAICDDFARLGYAVVAPAVYDRQKRHSEFDYDEASAHGARVARANVRDDEVMLDLAAAITALRRTDRVGIVGYGFGGLAAWRAACRLDVAAAACYYPPEIGRQPHEHPRCPVILHLAQRGQLAPCFVVAALAAEQSRVTVHMYPAQRAFANARRPTMYDDASARAALARTLAFFEKHVARH